MPPPHTTQRVAIVRAVAEDHALRCHLGHLGVEVQLHTLAREDLEGIVVCTLGEGAEQLVSDVDEVHARLLHRKVAVLDRHRPVDHVGQRARCLHPRRATPDDHEVQRSSLHQRGVAVGGLEHAEDARP